MKPTHLAIAIVFSSCAVAFTSCKKNENTDKQKDEIETTFELGTNLTASDNLTGDANDIFMEAATDTNLIGQRPVDAAGSMNILGSLPLQ